MTTDRISLDGKVALVTGAGAGLDRGIAEALGEAGATVVLVERDATRADDAGAWFAERGLPHHVAPVDANDAGAMGEVVERIRSDHGRLDVLVNNVGDFCGQTRPFVQTSEADWEVLHDANFRHVLRTTRAALPLMLDAGHGGSIVTVSTVEALRGIPGGVVYSAFKSAIGGFTRSLALEVGPAGIRVNEIAPETSDTEQVQPRNWVPPEHQEKIRDWIPLGRFGTPRDAAGVALFLASDLSSWVTGTTIPVDGGALAAAGWYRVHGSGRWTNTPIVSGSGIGGA